MQINIYHIILVQIYYLPNGKPQLHQINRYQISKQSLKRLSKIHTFDIIFTIILLFFTLLVNL